ncbi:hypothetical protein RB595_008686 [Gaeumannomyces hyphopodioides]
MPAPATKQSADKPDAIFGVDIGHGFVCCFPKYINDRSFQAINWPGCYPGYALPTAVAYQGDKVWVGKISEEQENDPTTDVFRHFKFAAVATDMDKTTIRSVRGNSTRDAAGVLKTFLHEAFKGIEGFYENSRINNRSQFPLAPWGTAAIDYQLSVPSRVNEEERRKLLSIAREAVCQAAGHGKESRRRHEVRDISLTEAEAAGVCAINLLGSLDKVGRTCLIIDIGSGTSDLAMLAVVDENKSKAKGKAKDKAEAHAGIKANFMVPVMSKKVGGSQLDKEFTERLARYLEQLAVPWCEDTTPRRAAQKVCQDNDYFKAKAGYSQNITSGVYLSTPLHGLESGASVNAARQGGMSIVNSKLLVDGDVFKQLFEQQLVGSGPGKYAPESIIAQVLKMRDDL